MIFRTLIVVLGTAAIAFATTEVNSNSFNWTGHLDPGQSIEIKGVNGSIVAEGAAGGDVEVTAEKSGRRFDPADVQIAIVDDDNGMTICAVYPGRHGASSDCKPGAGGRTIAGDNDVRVEFTVRVPAGVRFIGRTVNGNVQAVHLDADVEAHTINGKINVITSGAALADTVNGSIHAALGSAGCSGARKFSTVNGSIELELPGNVNADFAASTVNGNIDSDFPINPRGRYVNRHVHGTLGSGGGRELRLSTVNGSIRLKNTRAESI